MKTTFEKIEKNFIDFRKRAENPSYIAIFGKTFLDRNSDEYRLTKEVVYKVIESGFGVIHGAYEGVMRAANEGAELAIKKMEKSKYLNIGMPLRMIDKELSRSSKINLPAAETIGDRKKALTEFCDACIVMPSGGFGTMLESLEIFHTNQLAEKFGGKIRLLIFIGKRWKKIFDVLYKNLDMNKQKGGESFCHFVDDLKDLELILLELKSKEEI